MGGMTTPEIHPIVFKTKIALGFAGNNSETICCSAVPNLPPRLWES